MKSDFDCCVITGGIELQGFYSIYEERGKKNIKEKKP